MFEIAASRISPITTNQTELDSHADTSVAGANFRILFDTGEYATVHTFSNEKKPFDKIPIGTAATAWTDRNGQTFILRLNQVLLFGDRLDHSLLCPNQLRHFGHKVDDVPVQFDRDSTHSILLRSEVAASNEVTIPLMLKGVVSYFTSHYPTTHELDTCPHLNLTSDAVWDPNSPHLENLEYALTSRVEAVSVNGDDLWETMSWSVLDEPEPEPEPEYVEPSDEDVFEYPDDDIVPTTRFPDPAELLDERTFADRLIQSVTTSSPLQWNDEQLRFVDAPQPPDTEAHISAVRTKDRNLDITKEVLAKRWGIGPELAARTLKSTTQRGIRNFDHSMQKRYDTRLPHLIFPTMKDT